MVRRANRLFALGFVAVDADKVTTEVVLSTE
jgi:hypothetical protein